MTVQFEAGRNFVSVFSTEITKEAPTPVKGFLSEKEIFTNEGCAGTLF